MQTAITGQRFNICYIFDFYFTENFIHNNVKSFRMNMYFTGDLLVAYKASPTSTETNLKIHLFQITGIYVNLTSSEKIIAVRMIYMDSNKRIQDIFL